MVKDFYLQNSIRRELVKATRNELMLFSPDPKIKLEAAKQISSEPDIGLNAPPVPQVQVNIGDLKDLIDRVSEIPTPIVNIEEVK